MKKLLIFVFCLLVANFADSKGRQPIADAQSEDFPNSMYVESTTSSARILLHHGDCAYIFPTNVRSYGAWCKKGCFSDKTVCYDGSKSQSEEYSDQCICARQVTTCWDNLPLLELGCINYSALPSPPPFMSPLQKTYQLSFFPVKRDKSKSKKIKILLFSGDTLYQSCMVEHDDSGAMYDSKNATVNCEKTAVNKFSADLEVMTQLKDKNVLCAKVTNSPTDINAQCLHLEDQHLPWGFHVRGGKFEYSQGIMPGERCNQCFGRFCKDGASFFAGNLVNNKNKDALCDKGRIMKHSSFAAFRGIINGWEESNDFPLMRRDDVLKIGFTCIYPGGYTAPVCSAQAKLRINDKGEYVCSDDTIAVCPDGYNVIPSYVSSGESNLMCPLFLDSQRSDFMGVFNGKLIAFSMNEYCFVPHVKRDGRWVVSDGEVIRLTENDKKIDKMHYADGMYYLDSEDGSGAVTYKYMPQPFFCLSDQIDEYGLCNSSVRHLDGVGSIKSYRSSQFIDSEGRPFFLPKDVGESEYSQNNCNGWPCYIPTDVFHQGLCRFEEPHPLFNVIRAVERASVLRLPEKLESEDGEKLEVRGSYPLNMIDFPSNFSAKRNGGESASCNVIKIDMIGGGAAPSGDTPGNSGQHVSGMILAKDFENAVKRKGLLVEVGLGGRTSNDNKRSNGADTILYLCDLEKSEEAKHRYIDLSPLYHVSDDYKGDINVAIGMLESAIKNNHKYIDKYCVALMTAKGGQGAGIQTSRKHNSTDDAFNDSKLRFIYKKVRNDAYSDKNSGPVYYDLDTGEVITTPYSFGCKNEGTLISYNDYNRKDIVGDLKKHSVTLPDYVKLLANQNRDNICIWKRKNTADLYSPVCISFRGTKVTPNEVQYLVDHPEYRYKGPKQANVEEVLESKDRLSYAPYGRGGCSDRSNQPRYNDGAPGVVRITCQSLTKNGN